MIDLKKAFDVFEQYLNSFDRDNDKVRLKIVHTYGVVRCARELAIQMQLSETDRELAELIALLHDIGRFEQVVRFDSFEPATMDHASFGVELLFGKDQWIRSFIEDDTFDSCIRDAIAFHSLYRLPEILDERTLLHAKLIRDADKLDNCRVKLEDSIQILLGCSADEAGMLPITDRIYETALQAKAIISSERITKMDYWVSYIAYFFDLNFAESFRIILEEEYLDRTIDRIPYSNQDTKEKMETLRTFISGYIRKRAMEDLVRAGIL